MYVDRLGLAVVLPRRFTDVPGLRLQKRYRARERSEVIYANDGKISSLSSAGDIDHGRAWRRVRRVSDMVGHIRN